MPSEAKQVIHDVCTRLGIERVEKGLVAFEDYDHCSGWSGNFLALAYGPRNALVRDWIEYKEYCSILSFYEKKTGVPSEQVRTMAEIFEQMPDELYCSINGWLNYELAVV